MLVVTRLLFLTAFSYTGYPRLTLISTTPICPFTLQDSRFTVSKRIVNDLKRIILYCAWTFRFCSVAKALALRLCKRYSSAKWAEFPQIQIPEAVHQLTNHKNHLNHVRDKNICSKPTTPNNIATLIFSDWCSR